MEWHEVIEHPSLKNLPFKVETNEWGEIVMTPATVRHGLYQIRMALIFGELGEGSRIFCECGIRTSKGVKVADIAWGSAEFFKRNEVYEALCLEESP